MAADPNETIVDSRELHIGGVQFKVLSVGNSKVLMPITVRIEAVNDSGMAAEKFVARKREVFEQLKTWATKEKEYIEEIKKRGTREKIRFEIKEGEDEITLVHDGKPIEPWYSLFQKAYGALNKIRSGLSEHLYVIPDGEPDGAQLEATVTMQDGWVGRDRSMILASGQQVNIHFDAAQPKMEKDVVRYLMDKLDVMSEENPLVSVYAYEHDTKGAGGRLVIGLEPRENIPADVSSEHLQEAWAAIGGIMRELEDKGLAACKEAHAAETSLERKVVEDVLFEAAEGSYPALKQLTPPERISLSQLICSAASRKMPPLPPGLK